MFAMKFITLLLDCASISLQLCSTFFTAMILCFQLNKFWSVYYDYCYGKFFLSAGAGNGLQLPRATVLIRIYLFFKQNILFSWCANPSGNVAHSILTLPIHIVSHFSFSFTHLRWFFVAVTFNAVINALFDEQWTHVMLLDYKIFFHEVC